MPLDALTLDTVTIDDWTGSAEIACERGVTLHQRGALTQAEAIYREILRQLPTHHDSLHLLGMLAHQAGTPQKAVDLISQAIGLRPNAAHYRCNLANALRDLGRHVEAVLQYQEAERLRPDAAEIRCNLGTALLDLGRMDEAVACYRAARQLDPSRPDLHYNLANALSRLGKTALAEQSYRACTDLDPAHHNAHYNHADLLVRQHRLPEAEAALHAAITAKPDFDAAWNNLGVVLQRSDRLDHAAIAHAEAARLAPTEAEYHYNLGCVELARNAPDLAARHYGRALENDANHAPSRFALCMARLPLLYASEPEIARCRKSYTDQLTNLCFEAKQTRNPQILAPGVGTSLPFSLAYQGQDDLDLQRSHGNLVCQIMAAAHRPAPTPTPPGLTDPIRLGIVSGFFHDHTVWSLMLRGWLQNLDPTRFIVTAYHTGTRRDACTAVAATQCTRFVQGPLSAAEWRAAVLADAPHVLLYPEIGIDPVAACLAAQRLAPVQCAAWGHPVTTGMPTIDHFLSSQAMEPWNADAHYSENLVRLPGLGIYVEPTEPAPPLLTRAQLGLRDDAVVFWSGQSLYKYLPQNDEVFARVARAVPKAQFVFLAFARSEAVTALFRHRLTETFASHGLAASDYCVILPPQQAQAFNATIGLSDIILDTIDWSGGRSTLEALAHNPPIVTLPGPLMRSRHTAAMLNLMDLPDTIAQSTDHYVEIASRLAHDPAERAAIRSRTATNKHRLFRDAEAVTALETFLLQAVRRFPSCLAPAPYSPAATAAAPTEPALMD